MVLDTEQSDPWQGHSPLGSHPENYYCQAPGWYLAEAFVPWQYTGGTAKLFGAGIGVNTAGGLTTVQGQQHLTNSGVNPGTFGADLVQLLRTGEPGSSGSDYVQLQAFTTGTSLALDGSGTNFPRLSLRWAGTGAASSLGIPANASFPVPPAYVDEAWLNANVRDALKYLENPPLLRYSASGGGGLASGPWPSGTVIPLGTLGVDNRSAWSGSAWTCPEPGVHYIYAQSGVAASTLAAGAYATGITINGTTTWGSAAFAPQAGSSGLDVFTGASGRFRLSAGDTVSLSGFQNSGGSLTLAFGAGDGIRLVIAWESA